MTPTISFDETMATFRKYRIPMSQAKLTELLRSNALPFAESIELSTWTHTIWRLGFYRYLARHGVPVTELRDYLSELKEAGWDESWELSP